MREPRKVLTEFGISVPDGPEVHVWDSTAEIRYLVVPQRLEGTEAMSEEQLAAPVTRYSMIGTGIPKASEAPPFERRDDLSDMDGFGPIEWEANSFGPGQALGGWHKWNLDQIRYFGEKMNPRQYLMHSYFDRGLMGLAEPGVVFRPVHPRGGEDRACRGGEPEARPTYHRRHGTHSHQNPAAHVAHGGYQTALQEPAITSARRPTARKAIRAWCAMSGDAPARSSSIMVRMCSPIRMRR